MAIFSPATRNLYSLAVHSRALLISSRYQSSFPVRYIPADTQIKILQHSQSLAISNNAGAGLVGQTSDLPKQVEQISEVKDGTTPALKLSGTFNTDSNKEFDRTVMDDAEQMAIKLLAIRAFTTVQLQKKLCGKKFPLTVVKSVVTDLKSRGLINDGLYAESFSQSRWQSASWGPRRIKQALFKKGVSEPIVHEATKQVFGEEDGDDSNTHLGMSTLSLDHLLIKASKQWLRGGETSLEKRKARIVRWLGGQVLPTTSSSSSKTSKPSMECCSFTSELAPMGLATEPSSNTHRNLRWAMEPPPASAEQQQRATTNRRRAAEPLPTPAGQQLLTPLPTQKRATALRAATFTPAGNSPKRFNHHCRGGVLTPDKQLGEPFADGHDDHCAEATNLALAING